jgi:hypothetical protein
MIALDLQFCRYEVWPEQQLVATVFPDGRTALATREESEQNRQEAEAQGYSGREACWRSLVEHELLHSLVAEHLHGSDSLVLRTESGGGFTPTWLRYEEEMLALALQRYLQTGEASPSLARYPELRALPLRWRNEIAPRLEALWQG